MKNHCILIFLILFGTILTCSRMIAQSAFQETYTVSDSFCSGNKMAVTSSGNLMIAGRMDRNLVTGDSTDDGLVWMLDPTGKVIWTLKISRGLALHVEVSDIAPTPDGGGIVLLNYQLNNTLFTNLFIVKINSQGGTTWVKKMVPPYGYQLKQIRPLGEGYLISGLTGDPDHSSLFRIDEQGSVVWSFVAEPEIFFAKGAFERANGDIIIPAATKTHLVWIGIDITGEYLITSDFQNSTIDTLLSGSLEYCFPVEDSVICAGMNASKNQIIVMLSDIEGNPGSSASFDLPEGGMVLVKAIAQPDGGLILAGSTISGDKAVVFRIAADLRIIWSKTYGKNDGSALQIFDILDTGDGGIWLCGAHKSGNSEKMYFARTEMNGDIQGACCTKDIEVRRLSFSVILSTLGYSMGNLSVLNDGTIISGLSTSTRTSFCVLPTTFSIAETSICPGVCLQPDLENLQQNSGYSWSLPGVLPDTSTVADPGKLCYNQKGNFMITLRQDGCIVDTSSLHVDSNANLFPNAFTPNGDDVNETFLPRIYCPVDEYQFQVFSRWGEIVFETADPQMGWDGTLHGQPAPVDVYIYRVQYYIRTNGVRTLVMNEQKEVTLIR